MADAIASRYEVERLLGEGAASKVYLVRDTLRERRPLALKLLEPLGTQSQELLHHEFSILRNISHPNIAQVFDFGFDEELKRWFYTSEFVDGASIDEACKALDIQKICELFAQVLRGLQYIHSQGIVHFDIKPGNILVTAGTAKLIDFGLALRQTPLEGLMRGTVGYAAPEVVQGEQPDRRADLYSVGVVLYEVLVGSLPFGGDSPLATLRAQAQSKPAPMGTDENTIPPALEQLAMRLLERDPAARCQSANEIIRALSQAVGISLEEETSGTAAAYLLSGGFVGRDEELRRLEGLMTEFPGPPVVFITGGSGIGKSRLLREAAYRAQIRGHHVASLRCSRLQSFPLDPLAELAGVTLAASAPGGDAAGEDAGRRDRIVHETAERLIEDSKFRPAVIAIDDLDEAGSETMAALERIAQVAWLRSQRAAGVRMLVICACNTEAAHAPTDLVGRLCSAGLAAEIVLPPLSSGAQRRLLSAMFGGKELPERIIQAVFEAAGGNPLVFRQTLENLLESGVLFYESGSWHASAALAELRPPSGGEEVLRLSIQTLSRQERTVIEAMSCIARPAGFEFLCAITGLEPDTCAASMEELLRRHLIAADERGLYSFTSGTMTEVAYGAMEPEVRRMMHERAYSFLSSAQASRMEVALHADGAEIPAEELLPMLAATAEEALQEGAASSAVRLYEALRRRLPVENEKWFEALEKLARLYRQIGKPERVRQCLNEGLRESVWRFPGVAARIAEMYINSHLRYGEAEEAGRFAGEAVRRLRGKELRQPRGIVLSAWAHVMEHRGQMEKARKMLHAARRLLGGGRNTEAVTSVDYWLARVDFQCGRYDDAARRARAMLRRKSAASYHAGLHNLMGVVNRMRGKFDAALKHYELALELWENEGSLHGAGIARLNMGNIHLERNDYEKALDAHTSGKRVMEAFGDELGIAGALLNMGEDHYGAGHISEALSCWDSALAIARKGSAPHITLEALWSQGRAWRTLCRTRLAMAALDEAMELAGKANAMEREGGVLYDRAYALAFLCGDLPAATRDLSRAQSIFEQNPSINAADVLALSSRISLLKGEGRQALQTLDQVRSLGLSGPVLKRVRIARARAMLSPKNLREAGKLLSALRRERLSAEGHVQVTILSAQHELLKKHLSAASEYAAEAVRLARQLRSTLLVLEAAVTAAESAMAAGDDKLAEQYVAEAEQAFERIAAELPEKYNRKMLRSTPFYGRLDMLKKGATKGEPEPSEAAEEMDVSREELEAAGINEALRVRDGIALLGMVTRLATMELEVAKILSLALSMVIDVTKAERGFIVLVDEEGNLRNLAARNIDDEEVSSTEYQTSHTMVKEVINSGESCLVADTALDELLRNAKSVVDLNLRSVVCVPILHGRRTIGVVYLDTTSLVQAFSETDLMLMDAFAQRVAPIITHALEQEETRLKLEALQREVRARYAYSNIVGRSKPIQEVFRILDSVSDTDVTVYIYGETGTGKELVAKALHYNSSRRDGPYISLNCAALPESLLETELFGYSKGAFTGAESDKQGLIEAATGGTLFLDEIGIMPLEMQAKLLRVIEEHVVRPVGSTGTRPVNVRIVCASNRPLEELIDEGDFREDLFYRLNVVRIELPPLRDRREDIPLLVEHFLKEFAGESHTREKRIEKEALAKLCAHSYPGNIRQLQNSVYQAFLISDKQITVKDIDTVLRRQEHEPEPQTAIARELSVEEYVKEFILAHQGDYTETQLAEKLGITRTNLWQKRKKLGIPRPKKR
jgi:DNA-binding NtrC family response regulator/tetratricopeptide (TPR) repeat protein